MSPFLRESLTPLLAKEKLVVPLESVKMSWSFAALRAIVLGMMHLF
jgi:hypothetical protein